MQKNITERRKKPKQSDAQSMLHFDHFVFILCSKIVELNFILLQRRPKSCKMSVPRGNSSNRRSTSRSTPSTRSRPHSAAKKPLIRRSCQRKKRISAAFCSRFSSRAKSSSPATPKRLTQILTQTPGCALCARSRPSMTPSARIQTIAASRHIQSSTRTQNALVSESN